MLNSIYYMNLEKLSWIELLLHVSLNHHLLHEKQLITQARTKLLIDNTIKVPKHNRQDKKIGHIVFVFYEHMSTEAYACEKP